jgi:hypothetical protein
MLVASATISRAENLPSLSRDDSTWQSRRPTDQDGSLRSNGWVSAPNEVIPSVEDNAPANPYGGAAWQPAESANVVPRPAAAPATATSPAKQTRWIAPNGSVPRGNANPSSTAAAKPTSVQNAAGNMTSSADRPPAREPQQFVPPAGAARLPITADRNGVGPAPRNANSTPATITPSAGMENKSTRSTPEQRARQAGSVNHVANQQVAKAANTPGAQTNDSAARFSGSMMQPGAPARDQISAAPTPPNAQNKSNRAQSGSASPNHFANDGSWIRPLRQVAYQTGGMNADPGEMSLPDAPMSGGQWIDGTPGGPGGDGSCGPSCPCEGAYSCDSGCPCNGGCPCDGGPGCGDGCEPGCADEPGCGSSKDHDLFCVGWGDDESCHTIRVRVPRFQEVMILTGVHGFKGPYDQDFTGGANRDSGNFGFQEGINIGAKVPFVDWGYQIGFEGTQSELSGDANTGVDHSFTQSFVTGGVFHRTPNGLQGGIAWDWLHDERNDGADFTQLRGELSLVNCGCHECGVMGSIHLNDKKFTVAESEGLTTTTTLQATNQYLLFYRMHGCRGGEGRVFGGVDDNSDGIVGADFLLPMCGCWSLQSEFTYLIPDDSAGTVGSQQEAWNLAINLVWHWKGHARECHSNPYRPLFNVADNGSFIVDDRP